eukprot:3090608-Amphidinium_carterae.1
MTPPDVLSRICAKPANRRDKNKKATNRSGLASGITDKLTSPNALAIIPRDLKMNSMKNAKHANKRKMQP